MEPVKLAAAALLLCLLACGACLAMLYQFSSLELVLLLRFMAQLGRWGWGWGRGCFPFLLLPIIISPSCRKPPSHNIRGIEPICIRNPHRRCAAHCFNPYCSHPEDQEVFCLSLSSSVDLFIKIWCCNGKPVKEFYQDSIEETHEWHSTHIQLIFYKLYL